jgi:hypothetical protein
VTLPAPAPNADVLTALAQLTMGKVLLPLVNFATAISFYFHLRQFLSTSFLLRYDPDVAYMALLAAYAGHREIRRWSKDPAVMMERARRGGLFVVGWWAFYFVTLTAANHVARYQVPAGLLSLCLQVTAIFFGTLASQQIFKGRAVGRAMSDAGGESNGSLEARILQQLTASKGPMSTGELEKALGVPKATIWRMVQALKERKKVEWSGRSESDPEGGFRIKG